MSGNDGKGGSTPSGTGTQFTWDLPEGSKIKYDQKGLLNVLGNNLEAGINQGPKVFNQSLYAGTGATTDNALSSILDASKRNTQHFNTGLNTAGWWLNNGGLSGQMRDQMTDMDQVAGRYSKMYDDAVASLAGRDANFERVLGSTLNDVGTGVNASIGAMGRYGSGKHVGDYVDAVGDTSARMRLGERDAAYQRMNAALTGQAGAAQGAFGMGQQGYNNSMNAAGSLGALWQQSLLPGQTQLAVGQLQDADAQAALLAQNDLFRRQNDAALNHLQGWASLINGQPTQTGEPNPLMQILGIGAGAVGSAVGRSVGR